MTAEDERTTVDEAKRQALILVFGVAAVVACAWVERAATSPDGLRSIRMRAAKLRERWFATSAGYLWKAAEKARLDYESDRPA